MLSFTEFRSWMSPLCVGCGGQAVAKVGNKAGTGSSNPQFPNSPCPVLTRPPVKPTSPAELQKLSFKLVKSLIIQSNVYTDCYYRLVRQTWSAAKHYRSYNGSPRPAELEGERQVPQAVKRDHKYLLLTSCLDIYLWLDRITHQNFTRQVRAARLAFN